MLPSIILSISHLYFATLFSSSLILYCVSDSFFTRKVIAIFLSVCTICPEICFVTFLYFFKIKNFV